MKKQCFAAAVLALASVACFGYESHVGGIIAQVSENVAKIKATCPDAVPMAFWDFDGTIIKGDISEGLEEGGRVLFKGLVERTIKEGLCPTYGKDGGWDQYIKRDYPAMKEIGLWLAWPYNAQMYNGQRVSVLDSFCRSECERVYRKWYFDSSVRILKALESAGVENYIVSASPELFVRAAADTLGLPSCRFVGIRVEIDGDMVTSRVVHPLPMGEGKVENVRALVLARPHGVAVAAFGNSYSTDGAFLRYVATQPSLPGGAKGTAVMINGGADRPGYSEHFIKVEQNATVAEPNMAIPTAAGALTGKLENGASYSLKRLPTELVAQVPEGQSVRFSLEENATTGYSWEMEHNASECDVTMVRKPADNGLVGAPGQVMVEVKSKVQTPARVEFRYRRPWEKDAKPAHSLRLLVYTVGANKATDPRYPKNDVFRLLMKECSERGIVLVDWHLHIRGGMTPELAALREKDSGIRSSAMENHGREWEIYDNAKLAAFADRARSIDVDGHRLPVGIQVNDRDWFRQIDDATRAKFDYILADTMIMGKLPNGRDNRLWMVKEIADPDAWMEEYFKHNMAILDEPISILANPTYLPLPIADQYDRLWTEERMRAVIAKAVEKGIAIEIHAGSTFPRPKFLRLAKEMGAKFSFGTNNFDPTPKDLSRWLEAITWLDLKGEDIWSPECLRQ